jgi:YD repeat-containing protein
MIHTTSLHDLRTPHCMLHLVASRNGGVSDPSLNAAKPSWVASNHRGGDDTRITRDEAARRSKERVIDGARSAS